LDKNALISFGIPLEDIDRIYRALFVHSFGIFQMLVDVTKKVKYKPKHGLKDSKPSTLSMISEDQGEADSPALRIKALEK